MPQDNAGFRHINLWDEVAPMAIGSGVHDTPSISVHLPPKEINTGCGILVCPGGGYRILASDHEGLLVANALNERGIAAFVLRYRVGPTYHSTVSLLDGQRAMRLIRHRSSEFGIDSRRLGMLGFSAGGHLTVATGTTPIGDGVSDGDPVDELSSVPNFLVPVYAVTNGEVRGRKASEYLPADTKVNEATPPTFLVHTHEDEIVPPEQSIIFYNALKASNVPAELHVFGSGEHGVGLASGDPDTNQWFELMLNWLRRSGFLTAKQRVGVTSTFAWECEVPGMAWITFLPYDHNAPLARTRVWRNQEGQFSIAQSQGPVPGKHKMQIRVISEKWPHDADGDYSIESEKTSERDVMVSENGTLDYL